MARVMIPQNPSVYNDNAGSTTVVRMRANNPFESTRLSMGTSAASRRGKPGRLAGLGDGEEYDTMASEAPAADTGFDWSKLVTGLTSGALTVGTALATNRINTLYGPTTTSLAPVVTTAAGTRIVTVPAPASKLPWIIGGVAVLGVLAVVLMRRK